jgi:hypothetical protein
MSQEKNSAGILLPGLSEFEYRILYGILNQIDTRMKKLPGGCYAFSDITLEFDIANGAYKNFYTLFRKIEHQVIERGRYHDSEEHRIQ